MNVGSSLERRRWATLRRTRLAPVGEVDRPAVRELAAAIEEAERAGDTVMIDLDSVAVVRVDAVPDLLALIA
jgi:ABC-type transporter Mla MlaB component